VEALRHKTVGQIACGSGHTVILTDDGEVNWLELVGWDVVVLVDHQLICRCCRMERAGGCRWFLID